MSRLLRDIRFGLRLLLRNPGFAAAAVIALALGIGANTAIFSVVYAVMIDPLPYPNADQMVMVWSKIQGGRNGVSAGDYLDWKNQSNAFQSLSAWSGESFNVSTSNLPEQVVGRRVTPGFFGMSRGIPPVLGRDFREDEGQVGNDHELILSHQLWQRRFGGDPQIVGRVVRVNGESYTVVGVLPADPWDRWEEQIYSPLAFKPEQVNHDFHWLLVQGRLKPGVTMAQAQSNMDAVTSHIAETYPQSNKGWGAIVDPMRNDFFGRDQQQSLWFLMTAVGFVLLVACANVANLLLARGVARQKEIAVRISTGASRSSLFWQFLVESLTLAGIGGALGIAFAWAILKGLMVAMPPNSLPAEANVRLSLPVLAFTVGITLFAGVLFGTVPALHAARLNLNEVLKEGGRTTAGSSRHRLRQALVVVEFSLALTLLAGAGLAIHTLWNLRQVDLGIRKNHILTFSLPIPSGQLTQQDEVTSFYRRLIEKIKALPGVEQVSASTGLPLQGAYFGMPFYMAGKAPSDRSTRPGTRFQMVTPEYYSLFGIRLLQGRAFTENDIAGGAHVAMVNENFAKKYFGGADPLAQRVVVEQLIPGVTKLGPPIEWQIVGVYRNVRNGNLRNAETTQMDVPFWQSPWPGTTMAVRTTNDPGSASKAIAGVVQSMNGDLPISNVRTMDEILQRDLAGDGFMASLLATFSCLALLLAALGIYGVMAFGVAQRTHEIGMRMALGAGPSRVLRLILKEGLTLSGIGLLVGLGGAYAVERTMRSRLFGVGSLDPLVLGAVAIVLVASALLACYLPARHAMRVDPMVALRYE